MSKTWKPALRAMDPRGLTLTPAEGFLLSRIDGRTSVGELALLTAQSEAQVAKSLERLVAEGAVLPPRDEPPRVASEGGDAARTGAKTSAAAAAGARLIDAATGDAVTMDVEPTAAETMPAAAADAATAHAVAMDSRTPTEETADAELLGAVMADAGTTDGGKADAATTDPDSVGLDGAEEPADGAADALGPTHLALYREQFHDLPPGERVQRASTAMGQVLAALCFDPLPSVIHAILENPNASLAHARLIATHHRNAAGLEHLLAHGVLLRDAQVQRLLWKNPQLNEGQLRRLTASKRLLALWKLAVSREATAQTRAATAKLVRARFAVASAEERVELIFTTEGRALAGLSGLPVDGRTASMLCAKSYASLLLVQNLAKWSVAPGPLIAHLLRQPLVARAPQLRALLLRHPNAPSKG